MPIGISPADYGDRLHLRIFLAKKAVIDRSWNYRAVCSAYWRYYVQSRDGASLRLADGSVFPLPAGHVHFIPAWVEVDMVNRRPLEQLYIHFDIVGLPGTLIREIFSRPKSLPLSAATRTTAEKFRQSLIEGEKIDRIAALFAAEAALHAAVGELLAGMSPGHAKRITTVIGDGSPVSPALRHIEENISATLQVAELARLCGYGEDHFARLFKRDVGQTPGQYLIERRVALAAKRLLLSDDPIDEIAESCGFGDRFYFSRVFARRMGIPPAAYRLAEQPQDAPPPEMRAIK